MVGQIQAATDLKAQWQSLVGAPQPAQQSVAATPSAIASHLDAIARNLDTRPRLPISRALKMSISRIRVDNLSDNGQLQQFAHETQPSVRRSSSWRTNSSN